MRSESLDEVEVKRDDSVVNVPHFFFFLYDLLLITVLLLIVVVKLDLLLFINRR